MIDRSIDELGLIRQRYPDADIADDEAGARVLLIPSVPLGPGWSRSATPVWIVLPAGYPTIRPDCFYASEDLRLAGGGDPGNSAMQALSGVIHRWFSWHLATWDPIHDGLNQYVRFVERRLEQAQ